MEKYQDPFYQDPSVAEEFMVAEIASDLLTNWEWDLFHPTDANATAHFIAYYRLYGSKFRNLDFPRLARAYNSSISRVKGILGEILSWHGETDIPSSMTDLIERLTKMLP